MVSITTLHAEYFTQASSPDMTINQTFCNGRMILSTPLRHLHRSQTTGRRKGSMAAQGKQVQEWKGDIVVDDKDSQKTAAASSRGLAGLPERPEDMPQSTPAASPFMQVGSGTSDVALHFLSEPLQMWLHLETVVCNAS